MADAESQDQDIAPMALKLFERDKTHWSEIYTKARDDLFFLSDDEFAQWEEKDYNERIKTGRPALTIDQLSQFVHQVSNDIRQNTPQLTIIPDGSASSQEAADAYKGLIRNIEYTSNADDVYDTAANNAVKSSIGFIRIDHDYCDDDGFDQELNVCRVINPLACYLDANSIECDGRDAMHGTIIEPISVREFKKCYPGYDVSSFDADMADCSKLGEDDNVYIAEFFQIEETENEIANPTDPTITRKVKQRRVMRYKLSGKDVLESTTFPGKYIPLIPVYGEEAWMDGKRHLLSLIRKAKGAQRMYNVWKSLETEIIMKQPNAPVMAAEGQVDEYAADWMNPAKAMVLRYATHDAEGVPLPAPQRLSPPQIPAGIVNASRETVDDIKATMGLYNASIGQRSNETSGKAINARKSEGDVATFHFYDNLVRSMTHVYRVLIAAIPEIYDTARIIRVIGEEDEAKQIGVNGQIADGQQEPINLTEGQYTVRVVPGASYTTKRQEAAEFFTEIVKQQPDLFPIMGDLLFKNMDFAGAQAMAERMKKVVDPKFLSPEEQAENAPPVDAEKEQMKQIIQQGAQELQSLQGQVEQNATTTKLTKLQTDIKAQYEQMKAEQENGTLKIQLQEKDLMIAKLQAEKDLAAQHDQNETDLIDGVGEFLQPDEGIGENSLPNSI